MRFFGYFVQKGGGGLTQSKRILSEKTENFSEFLGGSGPIQNFLNKKNWASKLMGGGGLARSGKLTKKYFFMPPLKWLKDNSSPLNLNSLFDNLINSLILFQSKCQIQLQIQLNLGKLVHFFWLSSHICATPITNANQVMKTFKTKKSLNCAINSKSKKVI